MAAEPIEPAPHDFCAGDAVEVCDVTNAFHGRTGVVDFFVADNVYVTFAKLRGKPQKMFFADQLRHTTTPQGMPAVARATRILRLFGASYKTRP